LREKGLVPLIESAVIKLDTLLDAFDFVSSGAPFEREAFICKVTGASYWRSAYGDVNDDLPEDIDDADKYAAVPHKNDLDLGKRLVLRFAADVLPHDYDEVRAIFSRKGAYARFKDLLDRRGKLQQWYDYEEKARRDALLEWCRSNGIEVAGGGEAGTGAGTGGDDT
jgi:hypothetical protein